MIQLFQISTIEGKKAGSMVIDTTTTSCPGSFLKKKGGDMTKIRI